MARDYRPVTSKQNGIDDMANNRTRPKRRQDSAVQPPVAEASQGEPLWTMLFAAWVIALGSTL
ncbi:hypothetical protein ABTF19_19045, partial [Acinetobacter baumannii]